MFSNYSLVGEETVESLRYESQCRWEEEMIEAQDDLEARGTPVYRVRFPDDYIPF